MELRVTELNYLKNYRFDPMYSEFQNQNTLSYYMTSLCRNYSNLFIKVANVQIQL